MVAASWQRWGRRAPPLQFSDVPGAPGWRIADGGAVSGGAGAAVLLGIDGAEAPQKLPADRLDAVVHPDGGRLSVFTDIRCPNCATLLSALRGEGLSPVLLPLPLLGPVSELGARAAVAAEMQGGGEAFHVALHGRALRPSAAAMAELATEAGLDPRRLLRDMESPAVTRRLDDIRRAAETLGVWGTPATAVGRDVILGAGHLDEIAARVGA